MENEIIPRLIELENDVRYQESASDTEAEYRYIAGKVPVLISAPHGAVHTRGGKSKEEDEYTAGLAQLLGERTGAHVLYSRRKSATDPNADPHAPYKSYLKEIISTNKIRFVIDLHGAKDTRPFGIALGTIHGESCDKEERQVIIKTLEEFGFSEDSSGLLCLDIDKALSATGKDNEVRITRFCRECSISAAQIELNAYLRIPQRREDATNSKIPFEGNKELIEKSVATLSQMVFALEKLY